MIGPRTSGKSSLASLWTNAFTDVISQEATYQWRLHQGNLCELEEEKKMDTHVGLERKYLPTVRLRVRDYPGEERFRKQALREIGELNDSVVLILPSTPSTPPGSSWRRTRTPSTTTPSSSTPSARPSRPPAAR